MDRQDRIVVVACVIAAGVAMCSDSRAQDLHFQVHGASYHTGNRDRDWNERNAGAGLRLQFNPDWALQGGFYDNSYRKNTAYLLAQYTPLHFGRASFGVFGGYASGYEAQTRVPAIAGLMGTVRIGTHTSTSVRYVPPTGTGTSGVFAFEVGFRL